MNNNDFKLVHIPPPDERVHSIYKVAALLLVYIYKLLKPNITAKAFSFVHSLKIHQKKLMLDT